MAIVMDNGLAPDLLDLKAWPRGAKGAQADRDTVDPVRPRPDDRDVAYIRIKVMAAGACTRTSRQGGKPCQRSCGHQCFSTMKKTHHERGHFISGNVGDSRIIGSGYSFPQACGPNGIFNTAR